MKCIILHLIVSLNIILYSNIVLYVCVMAGGGRCRTTEPGVGFMKLCFSVQNFVGIKMLIVSKQYLGFMLTSDHFMNLAFEKWGRVGGVKHLAIVITSLEFPQNIFSFYLISQQIEYPGHHLFCFNEMHNAALAINLPLRLISIFFSC